MLDLALRRIPAGGCIHLVVDGSVRTRCWSNHLLRNWPTGCHSNYLAVEILMSCEAAMLDLALRRIPAGGCIHLVVDGTLGRRSSPG